MSPRAIDSISLATLRAWSSPNVWLRAVDSTRSVKRTVTVPSGISSMFTSSAPCNFAPLLPR